MSCLGEGMSSPLGIDQYGRKGGAWRRTVITVCQIVMFSSGRLVFFFSGVSELEAHSSHTLSGGYSQWLLRVFCFGLWILFIKAPAVWGMREVNKQCRTHLGPSINDTVCRRDSMSFSSKQFPLEAIRVLWNESLFFGVVWIIASFQVNSVSGLW